ncbi:MAG: hypothetical protein JNL70_07055 [Saprospiraceae bacterium]|nr:hypothetical protein [Saprospiraceae bacterium]
MANAIDDVLSKMSPEARAKVQQNLQQFEKNVQLADNTTPTQTKTPTPQTIESAQKTTNAYASNDINNRTPQQVQKSENAIDRVLSEKAKSETVEQGQNLTKQGVTVSRDR